MRSARVYCEWASRSPAIASLWAASLHTDARGSLPHRTVPDGSVDLIYRMRRDGAGRVDAAELIVAGATDRPAVFLPHRGEQFLGIRFAPAWGTSTLGVAAADLYRTHAGAATLAPKLSRLEESLLRCSSLRDAAVMLQRTAETWAEERCPPLRLLHAVQLLRRGGAGFRVQQAAKTVGISTRTLRRDLHEAAGMPPSTLLRIFRFRRALELIRSERPPALCDVALRAGYADHAHMAHDFRELGGIAPGMARDGGPPEQDGSPC